MKLEDQVVSLELSKKLKKLGIEQESLFYWTNPALDFYEIRYGQTNNEDYIFISAFTATELVEILSDLEVYRDNGHRKEELKKYRLNSFGNKYQNEYDINFSNYNGGTLIVGRGVTAKTEADAKALMLIYLKENKLI